MHSLWNYTWQIVIESISTIDVYTKSFQSIERGICIVNDNNNNNKDAGSMSLPTWLVVLINWSAPFAEDFKSTPIRKKKPYQRPETAIQVRLLVSVFAASCHLWTKYSYTRIIRQLFAYLLKLSMRNAAAKERQVLCAIIRNRRRHFEGAWLLLIGSLKTGIVS